MRQSLTSKAAKVAATVVVATTVSVVMVPNAQAATITRTVNGISYDISARFGSFNTLEDELKDAPWWGDLSLALDFGNVVADGFGILIGDCSVSFCSPNVLLGPVFAVESLLDTNFIGVAGTKFLGEGGMWNGVGSFVDARTRIQHFATAVRTSTDPMNPTIPTPALLPGLIGLGVSVWRKRKDESNPVEA
jgi:hypothetical protein